MTNLKYIYIGSFIFFIVLDHLIMSSKFGSNFKIHYIKFRNLPTPIISFIVFIIVFTILSILNYFGIYF